MFYVQNGIVIDMADFFPFNKHSIDEKKTSIKDRKS